MTPPLRDYQERIVSDASSLLCRGNVLVQAPTGSGKTVMAVAVLQRMRPKSVLWIAHRRPLLAQAANALRQGGVHATVCTPGQIPSSQYDLLVIDEAHRSCADTYLAAARSCGRVLGLTATPSRADRLSLGVVYHHIVTSPSPHELVAMGALAPMRILVEPRHEEIVAKRITSERGMDAALAGTVPLLGDWIATRAEHVQPGSGTIVFAQSIEHAEAVAESAHAAGMRALAISGDMSFSQRESILRDFKDGYIDILTNCDLLVEGFDCPRVKYVVWLRHTTSLMVWMQGCGRAVRPFAGWPAIVADHAGNYARHGSPYADRHWDIGPVKTRKRAAPSERNCIVCAEVYIGTQCPYCGWMPERETRPRPAPHERHGLLISIDA